MKTIKKYLSQSQLKSLFEYRHGELFWKVKKSTKINIGDFAGRVDAKGYFRVCIDGKEFRRSRIVYMMHFGEIPSGLLIDHRNEIKHDDRIENLRICTNGQNMMNKKRRVDNKSGIKGVSWKSARRKWQVSVQVEGKNLYVGLFKTKIEAARAYAEAAKEHHKEFAKL